MATSIGTTTSTAALGLVTQAETSTGVKWAAFNSGTAVTLWYNTGGGWVQHATSWASYAYPNIFIDADDHLHIVMRTNSSNQCTYIRGKSNGPTDWTFSSPSNFSYGNSSQYYPQVVAHREGTGWKAHITWTAVNYWESGNWWYRCRCTSSIVSVHSHVTCASWGTVWQDCTCYTGVCQGPGTHTHLNPSDDIGNGCYSWPTQPGYNAAGTAASIHSHGCVSGVSDSYFETTGSGYDTYVGYRRMNITSGDAVSQDTLTSYDSFSGFDSSLRPSIAFTHTGDGKTKAASPHVYIVWNAQSTVYRRRLAYTSGAWSSSARINVATGQSERVVYAAWSGTANIIGWRNPVSPFDSLQMRSVNDAGTVTVLASTIATGVTMQRANIVVSTNNIYALYNNGTNGVWLATYDGAWSAWKKIVTEATTLVGDLANVSVNRQVLPGGGIWFAYEVGSGSPYTIWEHSESVKRGGGWGLIAVGG